MALESFLIVLDDNVSLNATEKLFSIIIGHGGKINIVIGQGKAIIATFDNSLADGIRRVPCVKLLGGVTIGRRGLTRSQIRRQ
jgi:hypothetical protein